MSHAGRRKEYDYIKPNLEYMKPNDFKNHKKCSNRGIGI